MTGFSTLALVAVIGLAGPLLAAPRRWRVPVVIGQLMGGIVFGTTGLDWLHSGQPTFTLLADIGFALVMFVAGTGVPIRDHQLIDGVRLGAGRVLLVAMTATVLAFALAEVFGTGHAALYAVLMASSSAALVFPVIDSLGLAGKAILELIPQVSIADAACIIAVPLAIDPAHAARAAVGALGVCAGAAVAYLVLRQLLRSGVLLRMRKLSRERRFALDLRINLAILFALAALATRTHVSIMLAGFSFGLVIAAVGEPHRLARQVFGVTEGFLGPLFYVWLGASLNLRDLIGHPSYLALGVALGLGAVACHLAPRVVGQPVAFGVMAAAQLGVPVAAATLGTQLHLLRPGEAPALILGALITIVLATVAGSRAAASQAPAAP